jgi:hypothetical protein
MSNYKWFTEKVREIDNDSTNYFVCYLDVDDNKYKVCSSIFGNCNIINKLYNTTNTVTVYICDYKYDNKYDSLCFEPVIGEPQHFITKPLIVKTPIAPTTSMVPTPITPIKKHSIVSPPPLLPKNKYGSSIYDNTLSQRYDWDLSRSNLGSLIGYNQNNNFNNDTFGVLTSIQRQNEEIIQRQNEERIQRQNEERIKKQDEEEILQRKRREIMQIENQQKSKETININDFDDVNNAFESDSRFKNHYLNRSNQFNGFNGFN